MRIIKKTSNIILITLLVFINFTFSVKANTNSEIGKLIISEINWAGSSFGSSDEWIELQNTGNFEINLENYHIRGIGSQDIPLSGILPPKDYYLIANNNPENGNSALKIKPDLVRNITLSNTKLNISIINKVNDQEILIDEVNTENLAPFAGTNLSGVYGKASMERVNPDISGNISTNWKSAEFSKNLKPKISENIFTLDLGSPKSSSAKLTDIDLYDLIPTIVDNSKNNTKLFNLRTNLKTDKKYDFQLKSDQKKINFNTSIEFVIQQTKISSEKQFIQDSNHFTYITDGIKNIDLSVSLSIKDNSVINLQALKIQESEENLNEIDINSQNTYTDGTVLNSVFSSRKANEILISKSISKMSLPQESQSVILSAIIKANFQEKKEKEILELRIYNNQANYQSIQKYFQEDFNVNGVLALNYDFLLYGKGMTLIEIINKGNHEISFENGTVKFFDIEKAIENINLINHTPKNEHIEKTDSGVNIKEYSGNKIVFDDITVCKGKTHCQIKFNLQNKSGQKKDFRLAFGYKNSTFQDYIVRYFTLSDNYEINIPVYNQQKDLSEAQIIIYGNLKNLYLADLIAFNHNNHAMHITNKNIVAQNLYKSGLKDAKGFQGKINEIFETNTQLNGKYRFESSITSSNQNMTSNFSVMKIIGYDRTGSKIFDENITEKELKALNGKYSKDFELKRNSKIVVIVKYFGAYKKAKSDIVLSDVKITNIP